VAVAARIDIKLDNAIFSSPDVDTTDGIPETPTSRLTTHVLTIALNVTTAKDKFVRYRATQLVAHIVNTLDSIDDQLYHLIRHTLIKRLRDKESIVRVQAVLGLGRFADNDEENEDEDDSDDDTASGVLERLLEALQMDPSADVRRALLLNLSFTPTTLPWLMERARDTDAGTRRALYARILPALGDFRHLSLVQREKLLRWGLRDRDEHVRKATARLFYERWIEDCANPRTEGDEQQGPRAVSDPNIEALFELLERIDVNNSGLEGGIAHEAMKDFWEGRPDYQSHVSFEDPFFDELTAESAFVARTFTDFCRKSGETRLQSMLEDKMPEVTKFAFLLQLHLNKLVEAVNKVALNPEEPEFEEDAVQQEFCIEQLLHIALTLDYSDEMGRRKMFQIMREALALAELPEECTRLVIEILRAVCGSEEEFASIVLEAIAEVHDTISEDDTSVADESFHSARSELSGDGTPTKTSKKSSKKSASTDEEDEEKAFREIQVNLKCLHIAQCLLQNVQASLESSSHLKTMLNNLVVPAVRSEETPIREAGLKCMGLCCLLSKNLAEENLALFLHCFNKGSEALQDIAIQIISDVLVAHPSLLAVPQQSAEDETEMVNPLIKPVLKMYSKGLRSDSKSVATNSCVALSKLKLAGTITDADLLKQMVLAYFDPDMQSNPGLRQALTYFLPVFCHSKRRNAEAVARIAVPVLHTLAERAEDMDEDAEMVGTTLVAAQLCDWTDPRKTVTGVEGATKEEMGTDGHSILAEEVLEKILTPGCSSESTPSTIDFEYVLTIPSEDERKTYISLLGKLHLSATVPVDSLQTLFDLVNEAFEGKAITETAARNTLTRLQNNLSKLLAAAGKSSDPSAEEEVEAEVAAEDDEKIVETTEMPAEDEEGDETMMTKFTGVPDAEGTRFMDEEEMEEDEVEEEITPRDVKIKKEPRRTDESLVESLLSDDDEDTIS
jgi:condensin complex subunit 3